MGSGRAMGRTQSFKQVMVGGPRLGGGPHGEHSESAGARASGRAEGAARRPIRWLRGHGWPWGGL